MPEMINQEDPAPVEAPVSLEQASTAEASPAEVKTAGETGQGTKKRGNRGQTCKDRREHAAVKRRARIQEDREAESTPRVKSENSEPRKPKRRVALMLGFCGTEFQGMQVNPNARTIEGDLFKALCEAGAVSEENATSQQKVQLQRAARTDKGVHAAGQVVSLKMIVEDPDIVEKVNAKLCDQIRVWGFVRVVQSFNAKTMCDSRVYEYLLPTYVLMEPSESNLRLAQTVPFEERRLPETNAEDMKAKREYRVSPEKLQFVRDAFAKYKGSHDFRNLTVTRGCTESNSMRHMHWFEVSDPMIIDGSEWLSLKVKGQSFMLHQIRKMVGLVILMTRSGAPLKLMDALFGKNSPRINVPKAPSLGLLLESPVFDGYNSRADKQVQGVTSPVTFEPYQKTIDEFKQRFIYDAIIRTEMADCVFDGWVNSVEVFPEQYTYINKDGVIPESAIVVPGSERRFRFNRSAAEAGNQAAAESSDDELDSKDN
ncbi:tRNA pseudouridine synthase 1 [Coemansia spiralis]|uniref:tRNA pseudouridine synthase 1 n=1 Tax=Coemansia spiralis TaxID=417178 RepID=A0A9W8L6J1_9FUNG|nr:tRNA pseudouridine synthase 1 [Coemansia spiralis]